MSSSPAPSIYRLSPLVMARLVGTYLVVFAVALLGFTVVVYATGWSGDLIAAFLLLGLVGLFAGGAWLRGRAYVVRLDDVGYRVRLVRGAGVRDSTWHEVVEAVATHRQQLRVVVLRRKDGSETTIPVDAVAGDPDVLADDVRHRLQRVVGRPTDAPGDPRRDSD